MAVGNDQFLVAHLAAHKVDQFRIGDLPDAVYDAIFVRNLGERRSVLGQESVDFPRIAIKHENLAKVRPGGAKKIEPIGLRFGQGLLMTEDDVSSVVLDATQGDEAAALSLFCGS